MSSKRGRKRNDNLPPNRARDVQRAFRARRAAHLQALEQRVSELEQENNYLRQLLNIPPSNRPPLGKGPTGKDKSKPLDSQSASSGPPVAPLSFTSSRESSIVESPGSRTSSSPAATSVSMPSRPAQIGESGTSWNNDLMLNDGHQSDVSAPTPSSYQLTAPLPLKPSYTSYHSSSSLPSSSPRNSVPTNMYLSNNPAYSQSQSSDRPISHSYSGQNFNLRNTELRDDPPRHYNYSSSSFQAYDHNNMHRQSPSPGISNMQSHHQHHRESTISYPPPSQSRLADSQSFSLGQGFPHLPYPQNQQTSSIHHPPRQGDIIRGGNEVGHVSPPPRSHPYGPDGRLNHHNVP